MYILKVKNLYQKQYQAYKKKNMSKEQRGNAHTRKEYKWQKNISENVFNFTINQRIKNTSSFYVIVSIHFIQIGKD